MKKYAFKSKVWKWAARKDSWFFATVPEKQSREIRGKAFTGPRRGWISVPVTATIGKTTWKTSIFFDAEDGCFVLPLKAEVRKKEELAEGDNVSIRLETL